MFDHRIKTVRLGISGEIIQLDKFKISNGEDTLSDSDNQSEDVKSNNKSMKSNKTDKIAMDHGDDDDDDNDSFCFNANNMRELSDSI